MNSYIAIKKGSSCTSSLLSGKHSGMILSGMNSGVLSGIYSGILSGMYSGNLYRIYRLSTWLLSCKESVILSGIYFDTFPCIHSGILSRKNLAILSAIYFGVLSGIHWLAFYLEHVLHSDTESGIPSGIYWHIL